MSDPDIFGGGGGNPSSYILCLLTKSKPLKIQDDANPASLP
jgi:hypothetical protein